MATTTQRKSLTPEERAERVEALNKELTAAVEALASSDSWRQMLEVASRFPNYSFNNQLLLWAQSEQRGTTLTRVAAFGAWKKLGYYVRKGERGYKIYVPIKTRLRPNEIAEWLTQGRNPFDGQDRPRMVIRGFGVTSVFDVAQVVAGDDAAPLEGRRWVEQRGNGPAGLWDHIVADIVAKGFDLEHRPSVGTDQSHGWINYTSRVVWINNSVDEAEQLRIAAHEWFGHYRADHENRDVSRAQGEVEADSIAFIVLASLGLRIDSSSVEYVTGWSQGKPDLLRDAAETVNRVAAEVLAELETAEEES